MVNDALHDMTRPDLCLKVRGREGLQGGGCSGACDEWRQRGGRSVVRARDAGRLWQGSAPHIGGLSAHCMMPLHSCQSSAQAIGL
jgi:hypothetical protein